MKFDLKKLSKDVLQKRTDKDLSFRSIEKETKKRLSITTLQRIEAGTQIPRADTLADVCSWLGKPVQNYFSNETKSK